MADLELLSYPPDLTADQHEQLINTVTDWLIWHGLFVARQTGPDKTQYPIRVPSSLSLYPVTVFPSLFPRTCFNEAIVIQPEFNRVVRHCSCWRRLAFWCRSRWVRLSLSLELCLATEQYSRPSYYRLADSDVFIKKLWDVHLAVKDEGYVQVRPLLDQYLWVRKLTDWGRIRLSLWLGPTIFCLKTG
jgi:hypothetical protein